MPSAVSCAPGPGPTRCHATSTSAPSSRPGLSEEIDRACLERLDCVVPRAIALGGGFIASVEKVSRNEGVAWAGAKPRPIPPPRFLGRIRSGISYALTLVRDRSGLAVQAGSVFAADFVDGKRGSTVPLWIAEHLREIRAIRGGNPGFPRAQSTISGLAALESARILGPCPAMTKPSHAISVL